MGFIHTRITATRAQLKADMKAKQTALNRIRQSGSATEHEQKELEASISTLENQLEEHKSAALSSQQNFNEAVSRCSRELKNIEELEASGTDPDNLASLKHSFTLVISADYQMFKLIPHWGYSPQPGSTYYLQKLSHDIFGIVDHREKKSVVYTLDETVGPKNADHTVSYLAHYLTTSVPDGAGEISNV